MVKTWTKSAGIDLATVFRVLHFEEIGPRTPRLPSTDASSILARAMSSAIVHATIGLTIVTVARGPAPPAREIVPAHAAAEQQHIDLRHVVFIATELSERGGGGGGGNRQISPIRRAEGIGADSITLRVKRSRATAKAVAPTSSLALATEAAQLPSVLLDARPLAAGTIEQIGLPTGGVSSGTSTGPGSGGGIGTGIGTGIGPGHGPGIGPGSGGGMGGGVYRPGGAVTTPRVTTEVKPTYSDAALLHKIQGTVVLELVVTRDGRPSQIRVIGSLDPDGLDRQAIAAASQWRFEPGRLAGTPVDVLVTLMLDFQIR